MKALGYTTGGALVITLLLCLVYCIGMLLDMAIRLVGYYIGVELSDSTCFLILSLSTMFLSVVLLVYASIVCVSITEE